MTLVEVSGGTAPIRLSIFYEMIFHLKQLDRFREFNVDESDMKVFKFKRKNAFIICSKTKAAVPPLTFTSFIASAALTHVESDQN